MKAQKSENGDVGMCVMTYNVADFGLHLWLLRLAMSLTVCAVSEAKSSAPATGLVTVPTMPLPRPEKKPLTPPSVFTPSTVDVITLVKPPIIPARTQNITRWERDTLYKRLRGNSVNMLKKQAILTDHEQVHECLPLSAPRWLLRGNGCTLARSGAGGPWSSQVHLIGYQQTKGQKMNR